MEATPRSPRRPRVEGAGARNLSPWAPKTKRERKGTRGSPQRSARAPKRCLCGTLGVHGKLHEPYAVRAWPNRTDVTSATPAWWPRREVASYRSRERGDA